MCLFSTVRKSNEPVRLCAFGHMARAVMAYAGLLVMTSWPSSKTRQNQLINLGWFRQIFIIFFSQQELPCTVDPHLVQQLEVDDQLIYEPLLHSGPNLPHASPIESMTTMTLVDAKSRPMVHGSNSTLHRDSFVSGAKGSAEEKTPPSHVNLISSCTKTQLAQETWLLRILGRGWRFAHVASQPSDGHLSLSKTLK